MAAVPPSRATAPVVRPLQEEGLCHAPRTGQHTCQPANGTPTLGSGHAAISWHESCWPWAKMTTSTGADPPCGHVNVQRRPRRGHGIQYGKMRRSEMFFQQGVDMLSRQRRLDGPATGLQEIVRRTYRAGGPTIGWRLANALHGTWLGHPLHPVLTDIVIGAWTAGAVLDTLDALTQGEVFGRCADTAVALGVTAALPTALAGLTDWQHTSDRPRRVGFVHALLNITATVLQGTSLVLRGLGARRTGRAISGITAGALAVSAYLGSEMMQKYRIGVDRAPVTEGPPTFIPVMRVDELPENELRQVTTAEGPILLVRQGDRIYAMHATCTHMGGPLAQGAIVDGVVQCPWHGSRFALADGRVVRGPAAFPEQCLATRVREGMIEVGQGAGLGRCRHERVPVPTTETQPMAATVAFR